MSTAFFDIANPALGIPVIGASDSDFFIRTAASNQKMLIACGSNVMPAAVFSTSNVAIGGLVTPAFTLDVLGDINFSGRLYQEGEKYIGSQWTTTSQSNAIYINSCNVGINTSNPVANLDVRGSINFTSDLLQNGRPYIGSQWRTNPESNSISITQCNVGIGTQSPEKSLHIGGDTQFDGNIFVKNSFMSLTRLKVVQTQIPGAIGNITSVVSSVYGIDNTASQFTFTLSNPQQEYKFQNSSSLNMMRLSPNGLSVHTIQPGIGVVKLAVPTMSNGNNWWLGFSASNRFTDSDDCARIGTILNSNTEGSLYFTAGRSNNQSEAMRITHDGMVGIGLSNPTCKLHVNGAIFAAQDITTTKLSVCSTQSGTGVVKLAIPTMSNGNNWWLGFSASNRFTDSDDCARVGAILNSNAEGTLYFTTGLSNNQAEAMRITPDGMVGIGISNPTYKLHVNGAIFATQDVGAYSDIRLKYNIERLDNCLNKIKLCNGYRYDMKDNPRRSIGLVAQEVEIVAPELIHEDNEGYKAIAYQNMSALFVEAVKELSNKIDKINLHLGIA